MTTFSRIFIIAMLCTAFATSASAVCDKSKKIQANSSEAAPAVYAGQTQAAQKGSCSSDKAAVTASVSGSIASDTQQIKSSGSCSSKAVVAKTDGSCSSKAVMAKTDGSCSSKAVMAKTDGSCSSKAVMASTADQPQGEVAKSCCADKGVLGVKSKVKTVTAQTSNS